MAHGKSDPVTAWDRQREARENEGDRGGSLNARPVRMTERPVPTYVGTDEVRLTADGGKGPWFKANAN